MSEPYLAEIRIFGFNFAPRGWALCDGQILPINQYQSLYSLLGTTYGGDGRTSFALPDLRGRVPVHEGQGASLSNRGLGEKSGEEAVYLVTQQLPSHSHTLQATSDSAVSRSPSGNALASAEDDVYSRHGDLVSQSASITNAGGGQGHENMQPYLVVNFCIALQGVFPPRD